MNESRYTIMVNDRPAREEVCERRGINAQMARVYNPILPRQQPRDVEAEALAEFVGYERARQIIENPNR